MDENGGSWHVRRCLNRYQSYDPYSDTYVGYDGYRHRCRL
ncbi:BA14K family protein [Mesorhizobium sp. M1312]|nr:MULTISPECIES: BA14K family protein [unclassified Mesorhizobium]